MAERASYGARRVTVREKHICLHCGNPIMKGQEAVSLRKRVEGKMATFYVHYPACFDEIGGRLTHKRTGVMYRSCTPIWTRLGKDKAWHTTLKKAVRMKKRELGVR